MSLPHGFGIVCIEQDPRDTSPRASAPGGCDCDHKTAAKPLAIQCDLPLPRRAGASWRWRCRRSRGRPNHIARKPRAALQTGVKEYGLVGGKNRFNRVSICVLARNKSRSETLSSCWSPVAPEAPEGLPGPVNASCEHFGINDLPQIFFWRARPPRRPLSIQVRPIAADVDYRRIRANRANWTHHGLERVDLETPWEPPPLFRSS